MNLRFESVHRWTRVLSVAVAVLDISVAAQPVHAQVPRPAAPREALKTALTVQGGGTLGVYEGGLTWALVEIFRQRRALEGKMPANLPHSSSEIMSDSMLRSLPLVDFVAAAGASAGSINAFLAANRWCSINPPDSAEHSSFWRAWVSTGIPQMLPARRDTAWEEKGLFSRSHLNQLFKDLNAAWDSAAYDPKCRVPFGATMTRLYGGTIGLIPQIVARNQRYAAAFTVQGAQVPGTGPRYLRAPSLKATRIRLGALVQLPIENPGNTISRASAEKLIKASSGYPLAFEPVAISYCDLSDTTVTNDPSGVSCSSAKAKTHYFVDGGVFDNGPLTLAYALALGGSHDLLLDETHMLFVAPDQRRTTGGWHDAFAMDRESETLPQVEPRADGVDAVMRLISSFLPAARQYELQVAARLLPALQDVQTKISIIDAQLRRDTERLRIRADSEYINRVQEWKTARLELDSLKFFRDSLRYVLAGCRGMTVVCTASSEDSALAAGPAPQRTVNTLTDVPRQVVVDDLSASDLRESPSFDKLLYVTQRWHPLAGDWLNGFGGLIGKPLREYDFYVGVYDALALLAVTIVCPARLDSAIRQDSLLRKDSVRRAVVNAKCFAATLAEFVRHPPLLLRNSGRLVLSALYNQEFRRNGGYAAIAVSPSSMSDSILVAIVEAMAARMTPMGSSPPRCLRGGVIERLECSQGMDVVFTKLRKTPNFLHMIGSAQAHCFDKKNKNPTCSSDWRFVEFVDTPVAAMNRLTGELLARVTATTPDSSGIKKLLTISNAVYFATNERGRDNWDGGSTSVPPFLPQASRIAMWILPTSIGAFAGFSGFYSEWALRRHFGSSFAVGGAARVVWSSAFRPPDADRVSGGRHFVPSVRFEQKMGGVVSPWLTTWGVEAAYWSDWHRDQFLPTAWSGNRAAVGLTAAFLAEKIRVSWQSRPRKYIILGGKRESFVSIGLGDANGTLYWLGRLLGL